MKPVTAMGISELTDAYRSRRLDPVAVTEAHLERIASFDAAMRSYINVAPDAALSAAASSRRRWHQGRPLGAVDGVPIALKDNIDVAGMPCTAGTEAFRRRMPNEDAPAYSRLCNAGMVLLGKLNMHEGAMGGTTDNPSYGRCMNPLMPGHTPGGSSGGSGAAVAAGLCTAALGTDTMGSIRVPASYCGVYGFKPSNGAISMKGVVPLSFTLDTLGPLARSAKDLNIVTSALLEPSIRLPAAAVSGWRGLRIGRPLQLKSIAAQAQVIEAFDTFLDALARAGAEIVTIDVPEWEPAKARRAGLLVSEAEAAAYWERQLGSKLAGLSEGFAEMLRFPARAGMTKLVAAYETIESVRVAARRVFADCDLIALPTTAETSFPHTEDCPPDQGNLTALANIARSPAIAIPVRTVSMPASVQLIAAPEHDHRLLALAPAIDQLGLHT
jgi:Asp-tRNA(Asn)/Glu-tRNA(Gln) amidotransferase A subunit family amidase